VPFATEAANRPQGVIRDILANLFGKGWVALLTVLFVPFLIRYLGIEAYGLVGFFITLQAVLLLLDFGFSTTLNRSLSACSGAEIAHDVVVLAETLERLFIGFSVLVLLVVLLAAPWLVSHWLVAGTLQPLSVKHALQLMAVAIAFQLPFMLYAGGLTGLGRQADVNILLAACATLRFGGAVLVLLAVPTIEAFFVWQIVAVASQTLMARWFFFRLLQSRSGPSRPATAGVLKKHVGFATGVGMTAVLGVVLTQLDKFMLSKLLPLGEYGYYTLAWTLSTMLLMLAGPVVSAFFPRLAAEVVRSEGNLETSYHAGCQLIAVAVMPAGALLLFFSTEVLELWVGQIGTLQQVSGLVVCLALGTLLNTLVQLPHALQLAYGLSYFGFYANLLSVALAVPALYYGVQQAGAQGAAWVWVGLNAAYVVVGVPLMHRWLLRGHLFRWLRSDVLLPMVTVIAVVAVARRFLVLTPNHPLLNLVLLGLCYLAATVSCVLVLPGARYYLMSLRRSRLAKL